jgi:hypothetical protein
MVDKYTGKGIDDEVFGVEDYPSSFTEYRYLPTI